MSEAHSVKPQLRSDDVDPVTLAVFEGTLETTVREMKITMRRAAMSVASGVRAPTLHCRH